MKGIAYHLQYLFYFGGKKVNNTVIGVYGNGVYDVNVVSNDDLDKCIEWMKSTYKIRKGIFVNGKCVHQGYLGGEVVRKWERRISMMNIDTNKVSASWI